MLQGMFLGFISWLSLFLTFRKLPRFAKSLFYKSKLLTEIVVMILGFITISSISKSIVALFATAFLGLLTDISLNTAIAINKKKHLRKRFEAKMDRIAKRRDDLIERMI